MFTVRRSRRLSPAAKRYLLRFAVATFLFATLFLGLPLPGSATGFISPGYAVTLRNLNPKVGSLHPVQTRVFIEPNAVWVGPFPAGVDLRDVKTHGAVVHDLGPLRVGRASSLRVATFAESGAWRGGPAPRVYLPGQPLPAWVRRSWSRSLFR
jgi:hypothetical protein